MNPFHTTPSYFPKMHLVVYSHLRVGLPVDLFPSGFPTKMLDVMENNPLTGYPSRVPFQEQNKTEFLQSTLKEVFIKYDGHWRKINFPTQQY
jgi:hypothetical protein